MATTGSPPHPERQFEPSASSFTSTIPSIETPSFAINHDEPTPTSSADQIQQPDKTLAPSSTAMAEAAAVLSSATPTPGSAVPKTVSLKLTVKTPLKQLSPSLQQGLEGGARTHTPSRGQTPASASGSGSASARKRKSDQRASHASPRINQSGPDSNTPSALDPAIATASTPATSVAPGTGLGNGTPLALLYNQDTEPIPEALQDAITATSGYVPPVTPATTITVPSSTRSLRSRDNGHPTTPLALPKGETEGDVVMRDAVGPTGAELYTASSSKRMLRPNRGGKEVTPIVKDGVSASGQGVKVGGPSNPKIGNVPANKKRKGRPKLDEPNQDFCTVCRGAGRFLCCDGCVRSFHFMCLEPPLRHDELPAEDSWYCRRCATERREASGSPASDPDLGPIPTIFLRFITKMDEDNPSQFRLPADIRSYFNGMTTGTRGEYVDVEEVRTRYDRKGFQEERDGLKLHDSKSRPIVCYNCSESAMPVGAYTTDTGSSWRPIISCDYCSLSWHLDCLNPPMAGMPNPAKKWMCPNHAEQVMARRRTIRSGVQYVDVESADTPNNGNIVIIPAEAEVRKPLEITDMMINKTKYRIPENMIKISFWEKMHERRERLAEIAQGKKRKKGSESSLTPMSDSASEAEPLPTALPTSVTREDVDAAALIMSFANPDVVFPSLPTHPPITQAVIASPLEPVSASIPTTATMAEPLAPPPDVKSAQPAPAPVPAPAAESGSTRTKRTSSSGSDPHLVSPTMPSAATAPVSGSTTGTGTAVTNGHHPKITLRFKNPGVAAVEPVQVNGHQNKSDPQRPGRV